MHSLVEIAHRPLARLLEGVHPDVFARPPQTLGLRDLQRDMSSILGKMRVNRDYRVLTNRGAPAFLVIPIDPEAWTSLLAASRPDSQFELEKAHKLEAEGHELPDTDAVLDGVEERAPRP